jgi:hypothetical protein
MSARRLAEGLKPKPVELFSVGPELMQPFAIYFPWAERAWPQYGLAEFFHLIYK